MRIRLGCLIGLALLFGVAPALSQANISEPPQRPSSENPARSGAENDAQGVLRLLPSDAVSEKQVTINGKPFAYTVTAGIIPLYNQNGDRIAAVFYTAYVAKGAAADRRPISFVFNGGPGAASAYLHLGLVGPRIADFGPQGRDGTTAKLRDNPETWLEFTDIVSIDPINTGYSRPVKPDGGRPFMNVTGDADSVAKVIARYIANNSRNTSPKYLLGESYGGFRAGKVASALKSDHGIIVSGIVMVSPMLETSFQWGRTERDPFRAALVLPSLISTELDRTKQFTPEKLAAAERFALSEYLPALAGTPPTGENAREFYGKIAQMTDLPVETVAKSGGYIESAYLASVRTKGNLYSQYDMSFRIPDPYANSMHSAGEDPMLSGFLRALSGIFVTYARDELGYKTDMTYTLQNWSLGWDWRGGGERPGVSSDLRTMLAVEPSFRLMVVHGRSDLVTPYGISRYLLDQIRPPADPDRVQFKTYSGGHMFYFDDAERRAFTAEAKLFYQGARLN